MKKLLIEFIENIETKEIGHNAFTVKSKCCDNKKHIRQLYGFTEIRALLQYISDFIELTNNRYVFEEDIDNMLKMPCVTCMEDFLEKQELIE